MTIKVSIEDSFVREAKRLPPDRRRSVRKALEKFLLEPKLPSLRFRALEAAQGYYIINSSHGDRIILRKDAEDAFAVVDAGPHDNVYRRWNR
ncbi:hypothetical protein [Bradyrhizobium sp. 18]|uniref:type II toxin-antitoxin system RelE family toxin n=1 Tax=Bradyrhizobium sp. 18 TaxID=2782657 RepID=UPI001FFB3373|nr:hypothetical protein [Bradyrhizobium sp. 18]MCK1503843.1 hypothetical protein [Bradyrhizobium sp. 18]